MRLLIAVMLTFAVAALGSVGCGNKGKTSAPAGKTDSAGAKDNGDKSFTMTTDPAKDVKIKQGESQKVKISVTRGKDFKEKIKVTFKTDAKGLTFDKADNELASDNNDVTVSVMAAKDAATGPFTVTVNGAGGDKTATTSIAGEILKKE